MSSTAEEIKKVSFAEIILTGCLFCIGTFHEYLSCAAAAVMLIWLIYKSAKNKLIHFCLNITSASVLCIALFYGLTAFWAVDGGMAVIGFMKFLPVPLYLLVLMQTENIDGIISRIPFTAAVMTAVSAVGMQIPAFEDFFSVSGRLAGFFEYPNTFALFALISELIALSIQKLRALDFAVIAVLLFGIMYSGSRTVFVLAVAANAVLIFSVKNRRVKLFAAAVFGLLAVGAVIFAAASGGDNAFGRFLTISLNESTFIGRLLYFKDALPLILKHPFGLGYMGYYYTQQSVQTGVYSVMYIHNDFLQLSLDVGWLPALLFAAAIIKSVFCGKKPLYKRVILAVTALHCCFDFDLQFIAVFMLMLLFTDYGTGKEYFLKKSEAVGGISFLAAIVCVYFGISLALSRFGKYEAANYLYPFDTRTQTQLLINEKDTEKAGEIADGIISRNEYVPIAYTVKARQAYSAGNFTKVIEYKRQIFEKAPFAYEEYKEYCYMLITGITLYNRSGDTSSAQICLKELKSAAYSVHTAKDRLSNLGAKIKDQPETRLPDDIEEYLKSEVTAK